MQGLTYSQHQPRQYEFISLIIPALMLILPSPQLVQHPRHTRNPKQRDSNTNSPQNDLPYPSRIGLFQRTKGHVGLLSKQDPSFNDSSKNNTESAKEENRNGRKGERTGGEGKRNQPQKGPPETQRKASRRARAKDAIHRIPSSSSRRVAQTLS